MSHSSTQKFDDLLQQLATTANMGKVEKTNDNMCSFGTEEMPITVVNQSGTLILFTNIGNLTDYTDLNYIKDSLLYANALYRGTRGGTLGVESNIISFSFQYPLEFLTLNTFLILLENFIETATKWKEHLQAINQGEFQNEGKQEALSNNNTWIKI